MNDIVSSIQALAPAMNVFGASLREAVAAMDKIDWSNYFFQICEHDVYRPRCFRCIVERVADERS